MYPILHREQLSGDVVLMRLAAPLIAAERKPGQFVIVQLDSQYGERIPLTIADADPKEGSITIIFQVVGLTTHRLAALQKGDKIENLVGPLGRPTHIEKFGTVVCIGGGIGAAVWRTKSVNEAQKKNSKRYPTAKYGKQTKKKRFCADCGAQLQAKDKFCRSCGKST